MSYTKNNVKPYSMRIHPAHNQMIMDVIELLPPDETALMKRAYKLTREPSPKGGELGDYSAVIAHALTVGLLQLHRSLAIPSPYHYLPEQNVSLLLHDVIRGKPPLSIANVKELISHLEESRLDENRIRHNHSELETINESYLEAKRLQNTKDDQSP